VVGLDTRHSTFNPGVRRSQLVPKLGPFFRAEFYSSLRIAILVFRVPSVAFFQKLMTLPNDRALFRKDE
jgi:hypothetical protein